MAGLWAQLRGRQRNGGDCCFLLEFRHASLGANACACTLNHEACRGLVGDWPHYVRSVRSTSHVVERSAQRSGGSFESCTGRRPDAWVLPCRATSPLPGARPDLHEHPWAAAFAAVHPLNRCHGGWAAVCRSVDKLAYPPAPARVLAGLSTGDLWVGLDACHSSRKPRSGPGDRTSAMSIRPRAAPCCTSTALRRRVAGSFGSVRPPPQAAAVACGGLPCRAVCRSPAGPPSTAEQARGTFDPGLLRCRRSWFGSWAQESRESLLVGLSLRPTTPSPAPATKTGQRQARTTTRAPTGRVWNSCSTLSLVMRTQP
jgi:hypothetical protein